MEIRPILLSLKQNKFLAGILMVQVALTFMVLTIAVSDSVFTLKEWNKPSGLDLDNVVSVRSQVFDPNMNISALVTRDLERLRAIPGVEAATPNAVRPTEGPRAENVYLSPLPDAQAFLTNYFDMDEHGTEVLGLELLEGRFFTAADVVISEIGAGEVANVMISESLAKELFAEQSAIGKTLYLELTSHPVQVVGVYSDFLAGSNLNFRGKSYNSVIRPQVRWSQSRSPDYLIKVAAGQADVLLEDITDALYVEPNRYLSNAETLRRVLKRMYDGRGSFALVMLTVTLLLLLIATLGTVGLVTFLVNQRRKQIGIRRALGATKRQVMRYFLLENSIQVMIGLVMGTVLILTYYVTTVSNGPSSFNWLVLLGCAGLVWATNYLAVWFPAKAAAQISPAEATRGN
ncbi:ABC transporter permease [Pseudoalteromonas fenneropenaei]|uniref:ABC transporter permease n=1 Tax=Pseudoalteromonas fenneropenaei TaxID=1737459 RepID=A0ABV7CE41_9GAMM